MNFLQELRARKKSGPGSVEVFFGDEDKPVLVPLKYPKAAAQAEFVQALNSMENDSKDFGKKVEQTESVSMLAIRLCLDVEGDVTDDELSILIRESGGVNGTLALRCQQLLGFGEGPKSKEGRIVKGGKARGR